jgi:hypothetical protein
MLEIFGTRRKAAFAAAVVTLVLVAAAPPPRLLYMPRLPDELVFRGGVAPTPGGDYPATFSTYLSSVRVNARNRPVAWMAMASAEYLNIGRPLDNHLGDIGLTYPNIGMGDVVPAFGWVYRVSQVGPSGPAAERNTWIKLKKLPKSAWPAGARLRQDSFAVPLSGDGERGRANLHDASLTVESISTPRGGKPEAKVYVKHSVPGYQFPRMYATVREGDVLLIHTAGHRVRSVVPPDPKSKLVGWLELSPDPILEADLVRDKVPFVRPKLVKK